MKHLSRKALATLALLTGLILLFLEYSRIGRGASFELWFWIFAAALIIVLAAWELFSSGPPQNP